MAKVTVNQTPTQEAIAAAVKEFTINDENGRSITLKKPTILSQYRLVEIMGETAKNEVYMGMILPLIFVAEIDGEAVHFPANKREVEALIQRLDDEGVTAVMKGVTENFGGSRDQEADKSAIKK